MILVPHKTISQKLKTIFKLFPLPCLLYLFTFLISFSAHAQTFSLPTTSSTGIFTITWSGVSTYGIIDELRADGSYISSPAGGSASGSITVTRGNGTFYFSLQRCVVAGGPPVCSKYGDTKSITVSIPPATATASFSPVSVAPGGSSVLSWSSTNAVNCTSSNASQVSGTSGSFTYTVPANYTKNNVVIVLTCYQGGPGAPGTVAPVLRVNLPITYIYDELGRVKEINNAGNDIVKYEYDAADNRTKKTVTKY